MGSAPPFVCEKMQKTRSAVPNKRPERPANVRVGITYEKQFEDCRPLAIQGDRFKSADMKGKKMRAKTNSGKCNSVPAMARLFLVGFGALAIIGWSATTLGQNADTVRQPASDEVAPIEQATFARYASLDESTIRSAEQLSKAFRSVAELAEPSVARIVGYSTRGQITGSGFVIDSNGHLATNNHVVERADRLYVEFSNNKRYEANVVGTDPLTDLAVIHINAPNLKPVRFVDSSEDLMVGQWVLAIGFPLGLQQTVTAGIVSATDRQLGIIGSGGRAGYEDFIQTDAAINRGNSGGPLLNLRGEVVGINSAILSQTGGSDGLGFSIPASLAQRITKELIADHSIKRGLLGVGIQDITPVLAQSYGLSATQQGALIKNVDPNSPAGKAGFQPEDLIVSVDDRPVTNADELRTLVAMRKPNTKVRIDVLRDGREQSFDVVLADMNAGGSPVTVHDQRHARQELGLEITNARIGRSQKIVAFIGSVVPGSVANLAGLAARDIVTEIDSVSIDELAGQAGVTPGEYLQERINGASSGTIIRLNVSRDGGTLIVGLQIP